MTGYASKAPISTPFPAKWIPVSFDGALIKWVLAGNQDFDQPFFEDSIKVLKRNCREAKCARLDEFLAMDLSNVEIIPPTAFIFHVSRCGSTLITQMLSQSKLNIVYAEPPLLDDILSAPLSQDDKTAALQKAIAAMGQKRTHLQRHLFIKWDSWHLGFYQLIMQTFPGIPSLFLYRNPFDVLISHRHMRGRHMIPGMLKQDVFNIKNIPVYDLDAYSAAVLHRLFHWMSIYSTDEEVDLVNYTELPGKIFEIAEKWELTYSDYDLSVMHERSKTHSKQPLSSPRPDYPVDADLLERMETLSLPICELYERLEKVRLYNQRVRT